MRRQSRRGRSREESWRQVGIALAVTGKFDDLAGDALFDVVVAVSDPQGDANEFEGTPVSHSTDVGLGVFLRRMLVKKLLLTGTIVLLMATGTAHAQREGGAFFGPFSRGNSSGASGPVGQARPINVSPTTGRPYDTAAPDYRVQRRSKRRR